ncbi:MAG: alpha/beta hydrolase [Salaquimonas sp.]|nr:alpha/beta hydrolase [Salaquimonas sp.]
MSAFRIVFFAAVSATLSLLAGCQGTSTGDVPARAGTKDAVTWSGPHKGLLAPFKETAFRYRKPLEVSDGGRFMIVPYDELVDINKRDEVPVRKVRSWWVSKLPRGAEVEGQYEVGGRRHLYRAVGQLSGGSKMTVIYIHGRGGNKDWGFDDERFGGNFNRLKNMLLKAGGAYVSPDFTDFEADGLADVKALVNKFSKLTSGPLIVACGSLGNNHCWSLAQDAAITSKLSGLIVLSGFPNERFFSSPAVHSPGHRVALVISHGTWDPDFDYKPMVEFYRTLRAKAPDYPVRLILFETGKHGAPVRMIDWRDTLNWIAAQ